jgi:hypothetical protein
MGCWLVKMRSMSKSEGEEICEESRLELSLDTCHFAFGGV